ncbi:MAG: HAD-IA family hydrolase [Caldilineaceae bacterium]|nr:HAD-IA family hydrolase [Caldilineaceae bacterium]
MHKAFLTDLDGVIRIWHPTQDTDAENTVGLPSGAIKQVAFAPELLLPTITGKLTDEAWRQQIVERLAQAYPTCDVAQAVSIWSEPCGEVDQEMLALLRRVRRHCPVCLVTNATTRLPADLAQLGILDEFDYIINSSAVGWAKPQPEIFQAALRAVSVPATAALFVDDTAKNVETAQAFGLTGHHYQSNPQLVQALESYGIL